VVACAGISRKRRTSLLIELSGRAEFAIAQASTYKIGMITIQKLRDEARTELGDKFDWKAFHDMVIGGGSMPLPILENRVRNWIADQKKA
ncbi:MAG: DUF885 family protein, partial [Alphaproteobacteria bacterium]